MNKAVILLVFANDKNQPLDEIGKESQAIRKILRNGLGTHDSHSHFEVELLPYSSAQDLFEELRRFNNQIVILHFAGHTNSDLWKLHEGSVNANGMAEVLKLQQSIRLLFINGCDNNEQVEAFSKANIPALIATSKPINDQQAQVFATEFYKKLVDGKALKSNIQDAYNWAKATASAINEGGSNSSLNRSLDFSDTESAWSWGLIETQDQAAQWSLSEIEFRPNISKQMADYKANELQKRWDRLSKKKYLLEEQYDNETRVEEHLRIDSILDKVKADLKKLEEEMSAV